MTTQERLTGLLDYVERVVRLGERPAFKLTDYKSLLFHEHQLKNKIGIVHDLREVDEVVWLKIPRLPRLDPPPPPDTIKEWLSVARDPTKSPVVHDILTRTVSTKEAQDLVASGRAREEDVRPAMKGGPTVRDVFLRLDQHSDVKQAIDAFIGGPWAEWASTERPRRETIATYDAFFSLQQTIQAMGVEHPLEVVWGIGIARWRTAGGTIDHALIEQHVEIEIDQATGAILVRPRSLEPQLALGPYFALENTGAEPLLSFAREHFSKLRAEDELSPFVRPSFEPVLKQAVAHLDREALYWPESSTDASSRALPEIADHLVLTDTWAIYARPRSDNFLVQDLERLKDAVKETEEPRLPPTAQRLVNEPDDTSASQQGGWAPSGPSYGSLGTGPGSAPTTSGADDNTYYFPKPFNDEQIEIVRRLERQDGIVVQGPPGTGKTHTIANVICHYMATGRRVLVVSKGEPALAVLRDQIPDGVRDLTISLLSNERTSLKQLEQAVTLLADEISQVDERTISRDITDDRRRLVALDQEIGSIDGELLSLARKHLERVGATESATGLLPMDLAKRVVEARTTHAWLEDRPDPGSSGDPQFNEADITALRNARSLVGSDLVYLDAHLPSVNDLPDGAGLAAIHEDLANAERLARQTGSGSIPPLSITPERALDRAALVLAALEDFERAHAHIEQHAWLAPIFHALVTGPNVPEPLAGLAQLLQQIEEIGTARAQFVGTLRIPEAAVYHDDVRGALTRVSSGKSPFPPVAIGKRQAKELYREIQVRGAAIAAVEHANVVLAYIGWREKISRFVRVWDTLVEEFRLPEVRDEGERTGRWVADMYQVIVTIRQAAAGYREVVVRELPVLFPFGLTVADLPRSKDAVQLALKALGVNLSRHRLGASRERLVDLNTRLCDARGPLAEQVRSFIASSIGNPALTARDIADQWDGYVRELARLANLRPAFDTIDRVSTLIQASGAPIWAGKLRTESKTGVDDPLTPGHWLESWGWARQERYLRSIDPRGRLQQLGLRREQAEFEKKRTFAEIVRLQTYLKLKGNMSDRVKSALAMFMLAIRQIGAGTGVRARRFRRDARDAMERCYAAVPCWIMPEWRVSESLPAIPGSFDLVIVDEASQSDVRALPAILRAKKILVVGDDRQVSPTPVGIEEAQILQLRHNYLVGQPFGPLMLPGGSLYDLMSAVFPGEKIMLKEHFRCVEPIIRFSFRFYNGKIRPLRIPKASERLDPPLIDIYVPRGRKTGYINRAEAEVVVDEIAKIVDDPALANRSIGVISLISDKQAALIYSMLLERVGEEAFLTHDIACGDSATFQGKERDIMFLSMVACPKTAKAQTARIYEQRFNVALSRARDRMILVRSVAEEHLNPKDLKAQVLRHFRNPMEGAPEEVKELVELCESGFEREVFRKLNQAGYRVRPQVRAGEYRIDLVVEGAEDRRLAVELDGDQAHGPERWFEDYTRQLALERMGWRFWRCWGSSWTLDPDACFRDLTDRLAELGIEPLGADTPATRYTAYREIAAEPVLPEQKSAAPADPGANSRDAVIEIGDRVIISYNDDPRRHFTFVISPTRSDPAMGVINARHPIAQVLLGSSEEDEVDLPAGGGYRAATILKLEKAATAAAA